MSGLVGLIEELFVRFFPALLVGFSLFSMFFGGGNLIFPLWVGIDSSSPYLSLLGFILSSVLLPFYGVLIGIYFQGDYKKCLSVWGAPLAHLVIFSLLLFWIPLGSGPRCDQLAYGAFCELCKGESALPLWLYSLLFSALVYLLTLQRRYFLEILGKIVTPLLSTFLFVLFFAIFKQHSAPPSFVGKMAFADFSKALMKGYDTMDFIAAIFFSSAIINLLREKYKEQFRYSFVQNACLIAVALLTVVYVGMFTIGLLKGEQLHSISGTRLLATVGHLMLGESFTIVIFTIITLSVLSTAMALAFVFSDYLHKIIFKNKVSYRMCLFISVFMSYFTSIVGFEKLSSLISVAMNVLYPLLLIMTTVSAANKFFKKAPALFN